MISLELSTEYHVDENNVSLTQADGEFRLVVYGRLEVQHSERRGILPGPHCIDKANSTQRGGVLSRTPPRCVKIGSTTQQGGDLTASKKRNDATGATIRRGGVDLIECPRSTTGSNTSQCWQFGIRR
jgi:hypothetical protein